MNIAVYCASKDTDNELFNKNTELLGNLIGKKNDTLVYGGSDTGLMGIVAISTHESKGKVIGVVPNIPLIEERTYKDLDELIKTETMAERRLKMIDLSDIFICLPGGPGTLDEVTEVMDYLRIKTVNKPLIIFNLDGYYDELKILTKKFFDYDFLYGGELDLMYFADTIEDVERIVEQYRNI